MNNTSYTFYVQAFIIIHFSFNSTFRAQPFQNIVYTLKLEARRKRYFWHMNLLHTEGSSTLNASKMRMLLIVIPFEITIHGIFHRAGTIVNSMNQAMKKKKIESS